MCFGASNFFWPSRPHLPAGEPDYNLQCDQAGPQTHWAAVKMANEVKMK